MSIRLILIFAVFLMSQSISSASQIVVHPTLPSLPLRDRFAVRVRAAGGSWNNVPCYQIEVDLHKPRPSSMASFDFDGEVKVEVTSSVQVKSVRIRPTSYGIKPAVEGNIIRFKMDSPRNLSIEINGDIFDNLQLFTNPLEANVPKPGDANVIYFGPGLHEPGPKTIIPSNTTVYLAGGAVLKSTLVCENVSNVRILGRGIVYHAERGIEISFSKNVTVDGVTFVNPTYYTVCGGQSQGITIRGIKSFSSSKWSDGIDVMSCSDVLVDNVFLRTSDDSIAIYGHRFGWYGDAANITVRNSTLWADVAHPIFIGTHGDSKNPETIENLTFSNIDILNQDEGQVNYQGCFAINASDENLVRNVLVENLRIEDFEQGQLFNLRVTYNRTYATAPGRGIENVTFRNVSYTGSRANTSLISGLDDNRPVKNITFENLWINGQLIWDKMPGKPGHFATADMAKFYVGDHVENLKFVRSADVQQPH